MRITHAYKISNIWKWDSSNMGGSKSHMSELWIDRPYNPLLTLKRSNRLPEIESFALTTQRIDDMTFAFQRLSKD